MLQKVGQLVARTTVADEQIEVRQVAADCGNGDEQPATDLEWQAPLVRARRTSEGFACDQTNEAVGKVIYTSAVLNNTSMRLQAFSA